MNQLSLVLILALSLSSCAFFEQPAYKTNAECHSKKYPVWTLSKREPIQPKGWIQVSRPLVHEFCEGYFSACAVLSGEYKGLIVSYYSQEEALRTESMFCGESVAEHELKHLAGYDHIHIPVIRKQR